MADPAPHLHWLRSLAAFATLAIALLIGTEDASARRAQEVSLSRGEASTFVMPSVRAMPVVQAAALDRSMTPQSGQPYPGGSLGGLFSRPGLVGGFAAGFLGAGLFGLLFGHGMVGGLGSVASFLGLLFQLALLVMLGRLIWTWWHGNNAPAFAGLSPRQLADAYVRSRSELLPNAGLPAFAELEITESDFDCFERLLNEIQAAYARDDIEAVRALVTPDMMRVFLQDAARKARSSGVGFASDLRLLKGELTEAWREGDTEYAMVATGSAASPAEISGMWTFVRTPDRRWLLSAIQQSA
jgi:predicted lipid-binding transport protein (Tim44 family)